MNYLKNRRVYIAGPIEFSDQALDWRMKIKENLLSKFGLRVFDPIDDPKQGVRKDMIKAKEEKNYEKISQIVHSWVRTDLSIIDRMDFIIANLPYKVPTFGTTHEIVSANDAKKPVLLVCEDGKEKTPDWFWGFINHNFMFGSWNDLYDYLQQVDEGKHKNNNRWYFTYNYDKISTLG
jgi:nucleoside 2-deoxyribosyltransferase